MGSWGGAPTLLAEGHAKEPQATRSVRKRAEGKEAQPTRSVRKRAEGKEAQPTRREPQATRSEA